MATDSSYDTEASRSRANRPASFDSYRSSISFDSYRSTASTASFASSTAVHPRSISSLSDLTETEESGDYSVEVQRPLTPTDHDADDHEIPCVHVLCMFDFESEDTDHTSFRKNDILKVIAQEPSGWWAAQVDEHIGWIPSAFVTVIPYDLVETLLNVPHDLREYEYEAEALYNGHPISELRLESQATPGKDQLSFENDDEVQVLTTPSELLSPNAFPTDVTPAFPRFDIPRDLPSLGSPTPGFLTDPWHGARHNLPYPNVPMTPRTPRTPVPPKVPAPAPTSTSNTASQVQHRLPQPALRLNTTTHVVNVNKPTPPTPVSSTPLSADASSSNYSYSPSPSSQPKSSNYSPSPMRSRSLGSSSISTASAGRRRPEGLLVNSPASLRHLSTLVETPVYTSSPSENELASPHGSPYPRNAVSARPDKVLRITGDDDAQAFHSARLAQAAQPWYLKPDHLGDEIKMEYDGSIKAGTLDALVERLTIEPLKVEQEKTFRHTFLMTFRTFTTADRVLELLIERYELESPVDLAEEQFNEWREKKLRPTQARVLHVFTLWVEQYGMIEDDPHIIPRLRDFLDLVRSPTALAHSAKHILLSIDRRRHSDINLPSLASSASTRRSMKKHRNDLLRIDPAELARQLTLYEARLYLKIRPHECLTWSASQKGDAVQNLRSFVSTSDKVAAWVKMSVLVNDALGKRADTIDLWIKVAEKCQTLKNFSSMSAIVAALTSQVIAKLQLTWAHVNRASHVEPLVKLSEPTNNFAAYRHLFSAADGPCLPYIGIFLSDMVKVSETAPNFIKVPAGESTPELKLINFLKRQKMGEVAHTILRHQPKVRDHYKIAEVPHVMQYLETQLRVAAGKDEGSFWMRSQEVQHAELAHADIRKGLEAAGF